MRIELHAKSSEARLRELRGKARGLRLALARLREEEHRVLNSHQGEVDPGAEGKCSEDPAQEVPKRLGGRQAGGNGKDRNAEQHAKAGPRDTHRESAGDM